MPTAPEPPPAARADGIAAAAEDEGPGSTRVLVVDDEPNVARAVARLMHQAGLPEPTLAATGQEALEEVRRQRFDVVLCDIVMPGMDGIELLEAIRGVDLDLPVILLSGSPSLETARRAVDLGAFRYLLKPVEPTELIQALNQAAFAHRIARIERQALALAGAGAGRPRDKIGLRLKLDAALDKLWMAFQPIISAGDGRVVAYEALLRSRETSLPHPGAMLDAAERLDRLDDLGRRVRSSVARVLAAKPGLERLFINLHPRDLLDAELFDPHSPLSAVADRVVLELTERASLERIPEAPERIARLRRLGFRLAVDDLGSGYAGLNSIATLEPDVVKLDMQLIRGVDASATRQKIVRSFCTVCTDLGVEVVAEGIETVAERDTCRRLGCGLLQGFLFARPGEPFPAVHWPPPAAGA